MYLWRLRCSATWRGAALLLMLLAIMNIGLTYYFYLQTRLPFKLPSVSSEHFIASRRELARRVMKVQRQVETLRAKVDNVMSPSLSHELRAIARELDPRISSEDSKDGMASRGWVCQEVYRGRDADSNFYDNFVQVKCDHAPPFREVLTVLLWTEGWPEQRLAAVIRSIRMHYNVAVVVAAHKLATTDNLVDMDGVTVESFNNGSSSSAAINKAMAKVKTPLVLVSDSLTLFSGELSSLERLVRVLDQEGEAAGVAAGSYRTLNGTWRHGCLQRRLENYQLAYVSGYEHSRHECMFCDDVLGPFVARTSLLQKVPFTESLEGPAMLRDWFINVRLAGSLAVVCPDVMFFVEKTPTMTQRDWQNVASKWAVQYVWPHDGEKLEFSCEEVEIKCVNLMKMVSTFLVPPCCREGLRRDLELVKQCGEELGLYVELQAGSLLGAVKMDGILAWDFDADVLGDCKDKELWLKKGTECLSRKGCSSMHVKGDYFMIFCNVSFIDMACMSHRLDHLPQEYRSVPTKVNYNGAMFNVPPNPALISRNYYGPEYLRHEVHWRYTGEEKRLWNRCLKPGFHPCLENFPTDGNIRFMKFDHQLAGL